MARFHFEPDMAGIREILHSDAVQAELDSIATGLCGTANAMAADHGSTRSWNTVPAYDHHMVQGRFTSIATVHTVSAQGRRDQSQFHTLNAINH